MFTGIITDVGRVVSRAPLGAGGARFEIATLHAAESIAVGASIACAGCCLTATTVRAEGAGAVFGVDASAETLDKTTLGAWRPGTPVNIERALKIGDELGGHLVSGHVDGRAEIVERTDAPEMSVLRFAPPSHLLQFIAQKGSVALDGTSLTVNEAGATFTVALIPHTLGATTWGARRPGEHVNIEIDTVARYVARLIAMRPAQG